MNPKRILLLSLTALAASCVESADKPVLRGQDTTKKIQRQRQLAKKESGSVETCGGDGQACCEFKQQGTDYSYCTSVGDACISGMCVGAPITGDAALFAPVCVADGETACDVVGSRNATACSYDIPCPDETRCDFNGCVQTCTNGKNPANDEFTCDDGYTCYPSDSSCCLGANVIDENTGEEIAGPIYCF